MAILGPIIGAIGAGLGLGTIGTALLGVGLAVGAQLILNSVSNKKKEETSGGVQTDVELGGDVPRSAIYGKQATAGHLVYFNTYGAANKFLDMVFVVGDGEHDSLEKMWVNGKEVSLASTPVSAGIPIPDFSNKMWVRWFSGAESQAADSELVTNANPSTRWTSNHKLAGMAYVSITMEYDEKVFQGGIPQFLFQIKGLKLYDFRKDGTQPGGSGLHRWNDKSTWEWSENPFVQLYNFRRGLWLNDELVLGMGLPAYDLQVEYYMAAANVCDELVSLKAGGTEKRYRCGVVVDTANDHRHWIELFLRSAAGNETERSGEFSPVAGVAQVPVPGITDDDLIADAPLTYIAKLSRSDRTNAVFGNYSDPDQQWRSVSYPPRTSSDDEAADGGERFAADADFLQVPSVRQAQQLAEIIRKAARFQATAVISLPFKFIQLEPGDWLPWQSDRFGFDKVFRVERTELSKEKLVTAHLREVDESIYEWTPAEDELDGMQPVDLPGEGVRQSTVTGLAVAAVEIEGSGGQKRPALRVTWTPIDDPTVDAVVLEYRIEDADEVFQIRQSIPSAGEALIVNGIQADTQYEVRAIIETTPRRVVTWTTWIDATSGANYVVPQANSVTDGGVGVHAMSQALQNFLKIDLPAVFTNLRDEIERLAQLAADQDQSQAYDRTVTAEKLSAVHANALAKIERVREVFADDFSALASSIEALETTLNDSIATAISSVETRVSEAEDALDAQATALTAVEAIAEGISANGLVRLTAVSDSSAGALAAYDIEVAISSAPTVFHKSGLRVVVWGSAGVYYSRIILRADEVYVGETPGLIFARDPLTGEGSIVMYGA